MNKIIPLQEHDNIPDVNKQLNKFEGLNLVSWSKPFEDKAWGYYASYKIGAEWIDKNEALIVTPKRGMENIDFIGMFMTCFSSDLAVESFSDIYSINIDAPAIDAPALQSVVSPLIVFHFLGVVRRIKSLKKGYVHHSENLKKVKGSISLQKNEKKNIAMKRYDHIYCDYDEYSIDIPENRLLKKALLFSQRLLNGMSENNVPYNSVKVVLAKCLSLFENVSDEVEIKSVGQIRGHKLFKEYAEAIRLAKLVLRHFDFSINKVNTTSNKVVPFALDMSLLYEHYIYGLLNDAYQGKITYQYKGNTGRPDFLYYSIDYKAILDTKYIPKYNNQDIDTYVVRQLGGYGRDLKILNKLGCNVTEESQLPTIPCVIIYPDESKNGKYANPFMNIKITDKCKIVAGISQFYKIAIPLPTI